MQWPWGVVTVYVYLFVLTQTNIDQISKLAIYNHSQQSMDLMELSLVSDFVIASFVYQHSMQWIQLLNIYDVIYSTPISTSAYMLTSILCCTAFFVPFSYVLIIKVIWDVYIASTCLADMLYGTGSTLFSHCTPTMAMHAMKFHIQVAMISVIYSSNRRAGQ